MSNVTSSLNVRFAKTSGDANLVSPSIASKATKKSSK
tara:strand:+ start:373 stop:483 length:111 start_codon:yes stop_codon:yes gene_type:complete